METQAPENLDPVAQLDAAPDDAFEILELRIDWPPSLEIYPEQRSLWLRFFVITGDPLAWIPDRGEAWAAVTVDEQVLEIDVYVTLPALRRGIDEAGGDLAAAVGHYAAPVTQAALAREDVLISGDYHALAVRGETPRLLDELDTEHPFGTPTIQCPRAWGPIGLGALIDLVQDAFGPIDLDRTPVEFDPVQPPEPTCQACAGKAFGFPTQLGTLKESLCAPHQAAATAVNNARLAHAHESNRAGWRAVDKAAMRVNNLPEPSFAPQPPRIVGDGPARNDPCPCGSGKKYKRCHGA